MRTEVDEEDDDEENASVHLQVSSDPRGNFIVRFLRLRPAKLKHLICVKNTQFKSYMLLLTECVLEFLNNALWDTHQQALYGITDK